MKAIEINSDDIKMLLKLIPKDALKDILELISKKEPKKDIELIKDFIDQFDEDERFDFMMAHLLKDVLLTVSLEFDKQMKASRKRGDKAMCGHHVADGVIIGLKKIIERIESAQKDDDKHECDKD